MRFFEKGVLMKRATVVFLSLSLAIPLHAQRQRAVGRPAPPPAVTPAAGEPLSGLTTEQRADFTEGREDFREDEEVLDGLGPVFNERSCVACHNVPAIGGGSTRTVTRFARRTNGVFDALTALGGSLIQDHAIGSRRRLIAHVPTRERPAQATIVVQRRPTPVRPRSRRRHARRRLRGAGRDADEARAIGVAGRVSLVDNIRAGMKTVGKFGWKAQVPKLIQFAGDAYLNEMGITSPTFRTRTVRRATARCWPATRCPDLNDDGAGTSAAARLHDVARPAAARRPRTATSRRRIRRSSASAVSIATTPTLTHRLEPDRRARPEDLHPYSDFLLHDMGASATAWSKAAPPAAKLRTAPLWGVRFNTTLPARRPRDHVEERDPRARRPGRAAARPVRRATGSVKAKLMAFLGSL